METMLLIVVIVISQLLGFFIGNGIWKLISNSGCRSSEASFYIKRMLGTSLTSIFLAVLFLAMVVAFWQMELEFVPHWFLFACKIVLTINVFSYIMVIVGKITSSFIGKRI